MPRAALALLIWCIACGGEPGETSPDAGPDSASPPDADLPDADAPDGGFTLPIPTRPVVILMIGDGMGPEHVKGGGLYKNGVAGSLFMETLPAHGKIRTGNLSGTVDSAAAATTMSTGELNYNGSIGVDRDEVSVEVMVELAHRHGLSAGVVSNAWLQDATPAGFSAHADSRSDLGLIAASQSLTVQPDVMLGGGSSNGAVYNDELALAGYQLPTTRDQLLAASTANGTKIAGFFSSSQMLYTLDRFVGTTQPTLTEMSMEAIRFLDTDADGFFLMIEGALIDKASHVHNDPGRTEDVFAETADFDAAVQAVVGWAATRPDVTVIVTADHECGGLKIIQGNGIGVTPTVTWRWLNHTNSPVDVFATGNAASAFAGVERDQRWIHEVIASQLARRQPIALPRIVSPDGSFVDLPVTAATQSVASGFGERNRLDQLRLGADADGLGVGIEGLFEWGQNTIVLFVDKDFGAGTGLAAPSGIDDPTGTLDAVLNVIPLAAPPVAGYGAEYVIAARGGDDPRFEDLVPNSGPFPYPYVAGMRSLASLTALTNLGVATNFADGTRLTASQSGAPIPGTGWEIYLPWKTLYGVASPPAGTKIGLVAFLVNSTGASASNQCLPGWPDGTPNPETAATPLPGIVVYDVTNGTVEIRRN